MTHNVTAGCLKMNTSFYLKVLWTAAAEFPGMIKKKATYKITFWLYTCRHNYNSAANRVHRSQDHYGFGVYRNCHIYRVATSVYTRVSY